MTLQAENITKRFGGKLILDNFSARLDGGRPVCLMGRSGCGKTTLALILLGLLPPDEGRIIGTKGLRISAAFQEDRLPPRLNAVKSLRLVLPREVTPRQIADELAHVGLSGSDLSKPVSELSGGMRRRVAVARAVMAPSDLLLLDEPFSGLDDGTRAMMLRYIKGNLRERMAVVITHNEGDAQALDADILRLPPR